MTHVAADQPCRMRGIRIHPCDRDSVCPEGGKEYETAALRDPPHSACVIERFAVVTIGIHYPKPAITARGQELAIKLFPQCLSSAVRQK
jgi:hypothetical protein